MARDHYRAQCTSEVISFGHSRAFRARHVRHPDLTTDDWDEVSEHMGLFVDGGLAATFRIVHAVDRRLPVSDHISDVWIDGADVQFGRFVADPALLLADGRS